MTNWRVRLEEAHRGRVIYDNAACAEEVMNILSAAQAEAHDAAIEEAARVCSLASVVHPSCLDGIGGLTWNEFSESAQTAFHSACQSLAFEVRALKTKPEAK